MRQTAAALLRVVAVMMPFTAVSNGCYFTMRAGGKTVITMLFDCGFSWCVLLPLAYVLTRFTAMPIVPVFACVQAFDAVKCSIGLVLVKRGLWINNMVRETE